MLLVMKFQVGFTGKRKERVMDKTSRMSYTP